VRKGFAFPRVFYHSPSPPGGEGLEFLHVGSAVKIFIGQTDSRPLSFSFVLTEVVGMPGRSQGFHPFDIRGFSLDAQLRAFAGLAAGQSKPAPPRRRAGLSQVDMAYDILKKAGAPLPSPNSCRIHSTSTAVGSREPVSSLTKKVARGDRFLRTGKNTFGLRPEVR